MYCEKPCTKNISQSLILAETMRRTGRVFQAGTQRRSVPHFQFAIQLAQSGKLGKLKSLHAHPGGMGTGMSGWGKGEPEPNRDEADWDLWLGPAAWRPYSRNQMRSAFHFEKGGGLVGGGVLEWGSHCVDLCQWANQTDDTSPVEYHPAVDGRATALYANGVELVLRGGDWIGLGSCPVRFEGDEGWVEVGDSGKIALSSPALSAGRDLPNTSGYPATGHVRDFLNCVKTRSQPLADADVACNGHIACHALNIAIFLGRTVRYDPAKHAFIDDDEANRLRSEALRSPWRL
jgi:predicted dehydrogenase